MLKMAVLSSFGATIFCIFCLLLTELGNTISSLFGGGGHTPEAGENLTDSVQVSHLGRAPRWLGAGEPLGLAAAAKEAAIHVSRIKGNWQSINQSVYFRKCNILPSLAMHLKKPVGFFAGKSRNGGLTLKNLFL